jgi:hypothetical protein
MSWNIKEMPAGHFIPQICKNYIKYLSKQQPQKYLKFKHNALAQINLYLSLASLFAM